MTDKLATDWDTDGPAASPQHTPMPWPHPAQLQINPGRLRLADTIWLRGCWQDELTTELGCLRPRPAPSAPTGDQPELVGRLAADLPAGGYALRISESEIILDAPDQEGARNGAVTLHQLLPPQSWRAAGHRPADWSLPNVRIRDRPAMPYRGFLLDVVRHFAPVPELLGWIDLLAMHRMTHLQLHLTDDQGWRLELPGFPQLRDAVWRPQTWIGHGDIIHDDPAAAFDGTPHGGSYTPADVAEVVSYARSRGITVIPEIDLPGHSAALLHAMPELAVPGAARPQVSCSWGCPDQVISPLPESLDRLAEILAAVAALFPGGLLHIGGDEVELTGWQNSPEVRRYAEQFGGITKLQAHVHEVLAQTVLELGRRPMVWDEAFVAGGLPTATIVTAWRSEEVGLAAIDAGHDVVMAPVVPAYLDLAETLDPDEPLSIGGPNPSSAAAAWIPKTAAGPGTVLGGQAQLWTEYLPDAAAREYRAFPRLCLLSANLWRGAASPWPDPDGFRDQLARLDARHVNYRPPSGPLPWQAAGTGRRRHPNQPR